MIMSNKIKIRTAMRFLIFILSFTAVSSAQNNSIRVKSIEFRDLFYLSKYEIIDNVDMVIESGEIVINMDSLNKVLSTHPFLKSFNIIHEQNRMMISVVEKKPVYLMALRKGDKLIPFELDQQFNIISINRVHIADVPQVIVSEKEIADNTVSESVRKSLDTIYELESEYPVLFNEISEIDMTGREESVVFLNRRRTRFIIKPGREEFMKLNYAVGYFDRIKYYPDSFTLVDDTGIIKR